ncbi:MAG: transglycosylase SLT domain-containing protein [Prevotella sp.]|nr:transglycosylase SLT domain-containing protein [Prevotella sp.]
MSLFENNWNNKNNLTAISTLFLLFFLFSAFLVSCEERPAPQPSPVWGTQTVDEGFDLPTIQKAGELIALTLSGPDTYYDYQGRHLGVHYLMCEKFASSLGVRLRIEVCRDTAELLSRLADGDGDIIALRMKNDSLSAGWQVGAGKPLLEQALQEWYHPTLFAETQAKERQLLSLKKVKRRVYAPMLSKSVISHYDAHFKHYGRRIGWDWRLLAAQCYQESTFDPEARSWAGARGLMQIMPATADHLGLPRDQLNNPERSIEAATRYLKELEEQFADIHDRTERQNMVLASYNGGIHHIHDAMRLCQHDGRNPHRWADVQQYVLRLSEPRYYQDTLVHHGYMRGQETAEYVDRIRERYKKYRISAR